MPSQEIDDFTALTTPAAGDLLPIVDVSDTTDSPQGTTKKIAVSDLVTGTVVPDDSVTNAKLANMAQATIKGRASGAGTGDPTDLTGTQATAIFDNVVGDSGSGGTKGLVPAPGAGDAAAGKYLDAAGGFSVPAGTGLNAEQVQDVVGAMLADGDVDFTYDDPGASETNIVRKASEDFAFVGDISPSQLSAQTDNWNPTGWSSATVIRFSTDASRDITGLTGGADGRIAILLNIGSQNAVIKDESASSTAGNRFALSADITIAGDQAAVFIYDATSSRWRLFAGPSSAGGSGPTINATDGRIPYRSSSTAFSDSQLIRHSLYHTAFQDSSFTSSNNRIWDWYLTSNDNSASPSSYQRLRLQNNTSGWTLTTQNATVGGMYLKIGTESADRLYLRTGGTDRWFIGESNGTIHCNSDGGADIGTAGGFRPNNIYALNRLDVAGTSLTTGGSSIVDATGVSGAHSTFRFQILRAIRYVDLAQTMSVGAGAYNWNLLSGALIRQTLTANMTQAPTVSNEILDQNLEVQLIQDGTGSRTMIWPSNFKFAGGTAPSLSATASTRDIFRFRYDGTNWHEVSRSMDVR